MRRFLLLLATLVVLTPAVFAGVFDNGDTVSVNIEAEHVILGGYEGRDSFTFELTGIDGAPMPAGSSDDRKEVTVKGQGTVDFGEIVYDYPGVYDYTVERLLTDTRNIITDDKVYHVSVIVLNSGETSVVVRDDENKTDLMYEDKYVSRNDPVNTGDTGGLFVWMCIGVLALLSAATAFRKMENGTGVRR